MIKNCLVLFAFAIYGCSLAQDSEVKIKLPAGFQSALVAKDLGRARHIAVAANGDIYVKLERLKDGKGIYRLQDENKDGVYESISGFGDYIGTGIIIKGKTLYASSNTSVYKYQLDDKYQPINPDNPERIVMGLWDKRQHASKSLALDNAGNIYVNIGAPSNICQEADRQKGSPGRTPCPILDSAGGIWKFSTTKKDQTYKDGIRYATGLRNVVGLDWNNSVNDLYVTMHGRDMLYQHYPEMFNQKAGAELPSETFYRIKQGDDAGWPFVHYDHLQKKKIVSPEYGGDGKKEGDTKYINPIVAFPGHLAPNALLFYQGNQFPAKYKNGAFIAFHGSWNRAPETQEGFFVVFVPMKNGMPSGEYEIFADGFSGLEKVTNLGAVKHRPCGLAEGPDGSLYVSDDNKGYIWKLSYNK